VASDNITDVNPARVQRAITAANHARRAARQEGDETQFEQATKQVCELMSGDFESVMARPSPAKNVGTSGLGQLMVHLAVEKESASGSPPPGGIDYGADPTLDHPHFELALMERQDRYLQTMEESLKVSDLQAFLSPHIPDKAERTKTARAIVNIAGGDAAVEVTQHALNHLAPSTSMGVYAHTESLSGPALVEYVGKYICKVNKHRNPHGAALAHRLFRDYMRSKAHFAQVAQQRAHLALKDFSEDDKHAFSESQADLSNIEIMIEKNFDSGVDVNEQVHAYTTLDVALQTGHAHFINRLVQMRAKAGPRALIEVIPMLTAPSMTQGNQDYLVKILTTLIDDGNVDVSEAEEFCGAGQVMDCALKNFCPGSIMDKLLERGASVNGDATWLVFHELGLKPEKERVEYLVTLVRKLLEDPKYQQRGHINEVDN